MLRRLRLVSNVNLDATQLARCTEIHWSQTYTSVADGALALVLINVTAKGSEPGVDTLGQAAGFRVAGKRGI